MNTTATTFSSDHSWMTPCTSRRSSIETVLSIQGKETDFVRDTSDTDINSSEDSDIEYEPVTDISDSNVFNDTSEESESDIIRTKVIEVSVVDDADLVFADSEQEDETGDAGSSRDDELAPRDYWCCARCGTENNNPLYRYCEMCFKVRKSFFPPRPKGKLKRGSCKKDSDSVHLLSHTDSGVDSSANSQELVAPLDVANEIPSSSNVISLKRRAESFDRETKLLKVNALDNETDSDSDISIHSDIKPLVKTISDPSLTLDSNLEITKREIVNTLKNKLDSKDEMCITCLSEPKSGVFVHGKIAHICCCYKCAVKVWVKAKRCPVCNCRVSNVLKAVFL